MRKFMFVLLASGTLFLNADAQVFTFTREQMIKYTAANPYDRFPDGRPKVPDSLLEKLKGCSSEEVMGPMRAKGFLNSFERNFEILHPGRKLVGRAVTLQYLPIRPDVNDVAEAEAKARGETGRSPHQRTIDKLQAGDVLVVDLNGALEYGGIVGDNLATYLATVGANLVVDGAIRDIEGILPLDMQIYFRGAVPPAINSVMLAGVNVPVRIGKTTVMPGDVVFGDREGLTFVPPQFVQQILDSAEETHIHDEWTQMKMKTGKYKSSDLYSRPTDPALQKEYQEYLKQRKAAAKK